MPKKKRGGASPNVVGSDESAPGLGEQGREQRQGRREGARADLARVCPGAEGEPVEKEMMDNPLAASPATPARVISPGRLLHGMIIAR